MKHLSLLITAVIILTAFSVNRAFSQCVISFPYTEDFESFDSFQTTASCDLTVYGATANNWTQDQSDGGEWRADSAGTGSNSTGPGSTLTSSGNGVGTDYAPGTTSGTYMYTEASSATSCEGAFVNLVSPCMDFSGSGKYYRMYFAYHMFGGSFGSLHVDVHDGTTWTDSVWSHSGAAGTNWQLAEVDLSAFNGSAVQIRIRAVLGANFYSDCAIDAIRIEAYAQDYDGALYDLSYDHGEYHYVPVNHAPNYDLVAQSRNSGLKSISDVVVKYTGGSGSQTDSTTVGSMNAFGKDTSVFTGFTPSSLADSVVNFELTLKETDGVTSNNTGTLRLNVTEGMYSRDRGNISGGIGANTGTIQIGNMFELLGSDTLQSVDVFLNGTVAGDSIKVKIYGYSSGTPGTSVLATSKTVISSGNREWRTVKFPCEPILNAGQYFVAVEQLTANSNMSLGYSFDCYTQSTAFYGNGATWTEVGAGGFSVCLLVRLNLGSPEYPKPTISVKDTICAGDIHLAKGTGGSTYKWGPTGIVKNSIAQNTNIEAYSSFTLQLTATNTCGYSATAVKDIVVEGKPSATVSKDTIVCKSQPVTLTAQTNTGNMYHWINGPQNTSYTVNPTVTKTYVVEVDSANGCTKSYDVDVLVSIPKPTTNNDTTICEAQPVVLKAGGGQTYQWMNGPSGATYSVRPTQSGKYVVTVTDAYGCSENDTVSITVTAGPDLSVSNDTAICFGQRVILKASGATSYEWTGGPKTSDWSTIPILSKYYYVKGSDAAGCYLIDSVHVEVAQIPKVDLRPDTTICEGTSLELNAQTTDDVTFIWSTGDTTQKMVVQPLTATKYVVTVYNSIECKASDSIVVSISPLPVIDFSYTVNKRSVTFTNKSTNAENHTWKFGDGDSSSSVSAFHRYDVDGDYNLTYRASNTCGTVDTMFNIKIENLSVGALELMNFELKPNPARDELFLAFEHAVRGTVRIELTSVTGQLLGSSSHTKGDERFETTLDLRGMADGVYLLNIQTEEGGTSRRIVIAR